jgi:hypothetical protein
VTPDEEIRRGRHAANVLDDEIYKEAYQSIRERIVGQLASADLSDDKRDRLNNLLIALEAVRRYMEQVMVGGRMAVEQIERERTMTQRIGDRLRATM